MKLYIVKVGALSYQDLRMCSFDAITHAIELFPGARCISARLAK